MRNEDTNVTYQLATVTEMQAIVRLAAEPPRAGELVKAQINRAARMLGLSARRAETFWYGRPTRILAEEADTLRAWCIARRRQRRDRLLAEIVALDETDRQLSLALRDEQEQLRLSLPLGDRRVPI